MSSNKYPVTYTKMHKDPRDPSKVDHVEMHHANIDFGDNKPTTPERVKHLVANSPEHKALKAKGYTLDAYGDHKKPDNFYTYPVKITEDANRIAQLQMATNQAKQITKAIKYDETVHDILVKIELLGEKYGIDKGQLEYAEDEVREAMSKLESAVYELDGVFAAALQDAEYAEEDAVNDVVDETMAVNRNDGPGRRWYDPEPAGSDEVNEYGAGRQSYRKFKPKVAGTFKKESSIMKGIQNEGKIK